MAKKQKRFASFDEAGRDEAYQWYSENKDKLPLSVLTLFEHYKEIDNDLKNVQQKRSSLLLELRRALGIQSSSERKKYRSEKIQGDKRASLIQDKTNLVSKRDGYRNQLKKCNIMIKTIDKEIKRIDDIELSEEDLQETRENTEREVKVLESGGEPDFSLLTPREVLMTGLDAQIVDEDVEVLLPTDIEEKYTNTFFETRTRYDFDFQVAAINIHVEKGQDKSGKMISASTKEIGPPYFQVTWGFLANMTLLTTQYAIPFERLARLLSTHEKKFTSSHMCRYFAYVANRLLPIYIHLAYQLADCDLISGDDTSVRVIEVSKNIEENKSSWEHYSTVQQAEDTLKRDPDTKELAPRIAAELGFEFPKKNGDGSKKQLHTTVIWGKPSTETESHIIFYRSHLGNFGNLLDTILAQRKKAKKELFIQSDLATSNLISDPFLLEHLHITQFGCSSHARRPFALYEESDPLCVAILAEFRNIYHIEKCLDVWGRNMTNVFEMRNQFAIKSWESILNYCKMATKKWNKSTSVGAAAHYVIKHYEKLTAYLKHPAVPLSNDLSERMLRMEKLIQVNALFRNSLEGRFALDICRTIVQTALAAGVNVKDYLMYVLKQKNIQDTPHLFTPFEFSKNKA